MVRRTAERILRLGRLRLRGPRGAQFEFTLAAIAQNLRRLAKLVAPPHVHVAFAGAGEPCLSLVLRALGSEPLGLDVEALLGALPAHG